MWKFLSSLALTALVLAGPARAQAPGASPFPPGEGRDIVATACTQCHGPQTFTPWRENAQAWRNQVYDMILRGAQITPSEMDTVVKYLVTNFGPGVNVPKGADVTLADGDGKQIVEGGCGLCHGLDRVAAAKRSKDQWEKIVKRMVFVGAPLNDDQAKTAVAYLDANYGSEVQKAAAK